MTIARLEASTDPIVTPPDTKALPAGVEIIDTFHHTALPQGGKVFIVETKSFFNACALVHVTPKGEVFMFPKRDMFYRQLTVHPGGRFVYQWNPLTLVCPPFAHFSVHCYDLTTRHAIKIPNKRRLAAVSGTSDGRYVMCFSQADGRFEVWETIKQRNPQRVAKITINDIGFCPENCMHLSTDENFCVISSNFENIIIDVSDKTKPVVTNSIRMPGVLWTQSVTLLPDQKHFLTTNALNGFRIFDIDAKMNAKCKKLVPLSADCKGLAMRNCVVVPDDKHVITFASEHKLERPALFEVWNIEDTCSPVRVAEYTAYVPSRRFSLSMTPEWKVMLGDGSLVEFPELKLATTFQALMKQFADMPAPVSQLSLEYCHRMFKPITQIVANQQGQDVSREELPANFLVKL